MKDIHLVYYDESDYDIEAFYDTTRILVTMNSYDHLDEPIEEIYFAAFFGRLVDDIPFLSCICRHIWAYQTDEDKQYVVLNAFGHILNFMDHVGAIAMQKDQCLFQREYSDVGSFLPMEEVI